MRDGFWGPVLVGNYVEVVWILYIGIGCLLLYVHFYLFKSSEVVNVIECCICCLNCIKQEGFTLKETEETMSDFFLKSEGKSCKSDRVGLVAREPRHELPVRSPSTVMPRWQVLRAGCDN
jgi:hypothetical protein